jgi:hypothetical protein
MQSVVTAAVLADLLDPVKDTDTPVLLIQKVRQSGTARTPPVL